MEINRELLNKLVEVFSDLAKRIVQAFQEFLKWIKENVIYLYQLEEELPAPNRNLHKKDFTRRKMQHQVINSKPRHLIKKIIR